MTAKYLISYDLVAPGKDYSALEKALRTMGAERVLYSQWVVVRTGSSCTAIRDHLWQYMDRNDRLLVTVITDWASQNALIDINRKAA